SPSSCCRKTSHRICSTHSGHLPCRLHHSTGTWVALSVLLLAAMSSQRSQDARAECSRQWNETHTQNRYRTLNRRMCVSSGFTSKPSTITEMRTRLTPKSVVNQIKRLERHINELKMVPATHRYRSAVVLALLSKALTMGRAICRLVKSGFPAEAFGLSRSLI